MAVTRGRAITSFGQFFPAISGSGEAPVYTVTSWGWLTTRVTRWLTVNHEDKLTSSEGDKLTGNLRGE
jgi:hypothetical protein